MWGVDILGDEAGKVGWDENGVGLECLAREFGLFGREWVGKSDGNALVG